MGTYSSVVPSGKWSGTLVSPFSRQSTIPSAHRHGCGHISSPVHWPLIAFSAKPAMCYFKSLYTC